MATRSLILSLLLLLPIQVLAQESPFGSIHGTVTDASTGDVLPGANVIVKELTMGATTDINGQYKIEQLPGGSFTIIASFVGFDSDPVENVLVTPGEVTEVNIALKPGLALDEVVVTAESDPVRKSQVSAARRSTRTMYSESHERRRLPQHNTEDYDYFEDNNFRGVDGNPLSTFSIDVDAASYSNMRRFIKQGYKPPKDAVRIEELINYFTYDYVQPEDPYPFSITTEVGDAPWNPAHKLVHIGLQGKKMAEEDRPASNLVFLLDVSGSMKSKQKLPLVKAAMHMLVDQLTEKDRVAIVVYAGAAGVVLPSTPGHKKKRILSSLGRLQAGGSTAGAQGIQLAYRIAHQNFIPDGNNRVILATDGDFNVGMSSDGELVRLIEKKRKGGTFLTVLGFGTGNLKDSRMEKIADKGNGNYYYIDSMLEARKVFVSELGSTLFTIAKDVKIQVEFNPAHVRGYRLIGYENRLLADEDFDDDTKDAGELGAGHTVTALYEVIPVDANSNVKIRKKNKLKYQQVPVESEPVAFSDEWMNVKLRYKLPGKNKSAYVDHAIKQPAQDLGSTDDFMFSAAVAAFGMILRDSEHKAQANLDMVLSLANRGKGHDWYGYRQEFIRMVEHYQDVNGFSE